MRRIVVLTVLMLSWVCAFSQKKRETTVVKMTDAEYAQYQNLTADVDKAELAVAVAEEAKRQFQVGLARAQGADLNGESWMEWSRSPDTIEFRGQWLIITPGVSVSNMTYSGRIQMTVPMSEKP